MNQQTILSIQPTTCIFCDRCGADEFVETPIHNGESVRCDCAQCGTTMGFPVWYGQTIELEQRPLQRPGAWL